MGAGVASSSVPGIELSDDVAAGAVEARLEGPTGSDWDLAVFDADGDVVAASAEEGASEVASGFVTQPGELTVQVCRIAGEGDEAALDVSTKPIPAGDAPRASLARVEVAGAAEQAALEDLGLDLTEHGGDGYVAVVLHGAADRAALDRAGLDYEIEVPDLDKQDARAARTDAAYAASTDRSALPSGSDTYRRLFQYSQEMKDLAKDNPDLVRPISLPNQTYEGRTVEGIEITEDAANIRDGKPVFLQMGVHHAREWPAGEHALEWAYELIRGYKRGDERTTRLVKRVRTIVIPIVNPDGFNASREAGEQQGSGNGEDGSFLTTFPLSPNEYRRKNCRFPVGEGGSCLQPAFGVASGGVDPNRNYGAFWGGPGASDSPQDEDYHGPAPFSEPESQNIRELVSERQVTMLITNHTFSNLVLRPPGVSTQPDAVDEPALKQLGDAMAAQNGYLSQKGYELYDTTGTTEDWSYNATGGFGYTFEIYCDHIADLLDERCGGNFHPTYPNVVAEFEGTSPDAQAIGGGGNREAYFIAMEAAANRELHSVLRGEAPPGAIIRLEKSFQTPTSVADPASVQDRLETEMKVPDDGDFTYDINPSTRPLVAQPQRTAGAGTAEPRADVQRRLQRHEHAVRGEPVGRPELLRRLPADDPGRGRSRQRQRHGADRVGEPGERLGPLRLHRQRRRRDLADERRDPGRAEPRRQLGDRRHRLGQLGVGDVHEAGGRRRAAAGRRLRRARGELPRDRAVHRHGHLRRTGGVRPGQTESWKLTCEYLGEKRVTDSVEVGRGQSKNLDLSECGTRGGSGGGDGKNDRCRGKRATLVGTGDGDRIIGTKGRDVIVGPRRQGQDQGPRRERPDLRQRRQGQDQRRRWQGQDQGRRRR